MPTWFVDDPTQPFVPPPTRSNAHLTVLSEQLTATELTRLLGMSPDETWERGSRPHVPGRFAGVSVRSRLAGTAQPDEHLSDVLSRLEPAVQHIQKLCSDPRVASARLWVSYHIANWNPGLTLSPTQVELVAQLGTGIEFDIYVLEEPPVD